MLSRLDPQHCPCGCRHLNSSPNRSVNGRAIESRILRRPILNCGTCNAWISRPPTITDRVNEVSTKSNQIHRSRRQQHINSKPRMTRNKITIRTTVFDCGKRAGESGTTRANSMWIRRIWKSFVHKSDSTMREAYVGFFNTTTKASLHGIGKSMSSAFHQSLAFPSL